MPEIETWLSANQKDPSHSLSALSLLFRTTGKKKKESS
jgi:hypothetical protein